VCCIVIAGTPPEPKVLDEVTVRLIEDSDRERFDEELATKHYLKNAPPTGLALPVHSGHQKLINDLPASPK
jgi:hypothetical protein